MVEIAYGVRPPNIRTRDSPHRSGAGAGRVRVRQRTECASCAPTPMSRRTIPRGSCRSAAFWPVARCVEPEDGLVWRMGEAAGEHHMTVNDLERLHDYGYWANRKLVPVIAQLTPEQSSPRTSPGVTARSGTALVHIMSAEWADARSAAADTSARTGAQARGLSDPGVAPRDVDDTVETHVRGFLASLADRRPAAKRRVQDARQRCRRTSCGSGI